MMRRRSRAWLPDAGLKLALQGGGAHGAFTWGVLDRLLQDPRIAIPGISGASAGAVNAVVLAAGLVEGGRENARAALAKLWRKVSDAAPPSLGVAPHWAMETALRAASPTLLNPLDRNPLRDILTAMVDVERLRDAEAPKLFISATDVRSGRARIFRNAELTVDVVLASACLPQLHQAVPIGDRHYWDGGFSANPPLLPLALDCPGRDVLVVQLESGRIDDLPETTTEIQARLSEIVFNAPLRGELEALAEIARPAARNPFSTNAAARRAHAARVHTIDGGPSLRAFAPSSKLNPDWSLVSRLHDLGREAADRWLAGQQAKVGGTPPRSHDRLGTESLAPMEHP